MRSLRKPHRDLEDQGQRDLIEIMHRPGLTPAVRTALLNHLNAESERKHERWLALEERKKRRNDTAAALFSLILVLLAMVYTAEYGNPWVAGILGAPAVVVVGKFLRTPLTKNEADVLKMSGRGYFKGIGSGQAQAPPAAAPPPNAGITGGPVP